MRKGDSIIAPNLEAAWWMHIFNAPAEPTFLFMYANELAP